MPGKIAALPARRRLQKNGRPARLILPALAPLGSRRNGPAARQGAYDARLARVWGAEIRLNEWRYFPLKWGELRSPSDKQARHAKLGALESGALTCAALIARQVPLISEDTTTPPSALEAFQPV